MNSQRLLRSSFKFIPKISNFSSIQISVLYSTLSTLSQNTIDSPSIPIKPISSSSRSGDTVGLAKTTYSSKSGGRVRLSKTTEVQLKEDWLASLCCPLPHKNEDFGADDGQSSHQMNVGSDDWVIGIDPDTCGALSLLKGNGSSISAQVFDSPYLQMLVGRKVRRRLDAKSMVQLLRSFGAPVGTTAYIEQSSSCPLDGKQSWWSGGFGYGLWIGILVALGFSVVPVPSQQWKKKFELSSSKDDSRRLACALFPLLSSQMKRKKDHGRAEALLIAAYGKGMDVDLNSLLN